MSTENMLGNSIIRYFAINSEGSTHFYKTCLELNSLHRDSDLPAFYSNYERNYNLVVYIKNNICHRLRDPAKINRHFSLRYEYGKLIGD